tara:strand:+ start:193 stop:594 length:402 start_codon:yes stop_codon:yes gene_type:complete
MTIEFKHRVLSTLTLLILDGLWINFFMKDKYNKMIKNIQNSDIQVNKVFAVASYTLMVVGLNLFVLPRLDVNNINIKDCLLYGFTFGIVLYGVYDFTIAAVLKKWDIDLAYIDVLWGGFVYFAASYVLSFMNN